MSTTFAEVSLDEIHAHLHNPRRQAVADDEMVESIKTNGLVQPLIVAPRDAGGYVLIAGHRRFDGLQKAGHTAAPAVIRADLVHEGQQLEAMLIENGRREDLTPIEEADGYEQLELFGYKPRDIAKATGRSEKTVKSRLKLRDLSTATRTKVHEGQVTIHDALELLAFTDQPDVLEKLETAAGTSNFQYELAHAQRAQAAHAEQMKLRNRVAMENIPEVTVEDGRWNTATGPYPLSWYPTYEKDTEGRSLSTEASHDGCLAWTNKDDRIWLVCSDPASHRPKPAAADPEAEKARAAEQAEWEKQQAERAERRQAREAASAVRFNHACQVLEDAPLPDVLLDMVQYLLPVYLVDRHGEYQIDSRVAIALGYPEAPRHHNDLTVAQMIRDVPAWTRKQVTRALAAMLVAPAEHLLDGYDFEDEYGQAAETYMQWLADTDHTFCDVDNEVRDEIAHALTEDDDEAVAS